MSITKNCERKYSLLTICLRGDSMINNINNQVVNNYVGFVLTQGQGQPAAQKSNAASDQVQISAEAQEMADGRSFRESLIRNGLLNMRRVQVDGEDGWIAFVTADGIWKSTDGGATSSWLDTSAGIPGVPAATIRELEHLSKMLAFLPPSTTMGISFADRIVPAEGGELGRVEPLPQPTLKEGLQQIVNSFVSVREGFGNSNQHMQFSEAAFMHMLNQGLLAGQLTRMNLGGGPAPNVDLETIEYMREQARQQINQFGRTFLDNFGRYGAERAFEIAWERAIGAETGN
jgi:hypothetical protein